MRIVKHIWLTAIFLLLWGLSAMAQDRQWTVCAGDTGIAYFVSGWESSTFEWSVEGGTITRNYGDSVIVDWPLETGSYTITVQEISADGCTGELKSGIVDVVGPEIELGGDTHICEGELFEITPEGDFYSYQWHDGSTGPSYQTGEEGWINLEVTDIYGCAISDSLYLSVYGMPRVDLGSDTSLCGEQSLLLDAGPDGELYNWSTGDIDRMITVFRDGKQEIWVIVENAFGCSNSDTILIDACDVSFYFRDIPTAITPNDDGKNDYWELDKLNGYSKAVVEIYNQWGNLVWRSEPGYSIPWGGRDMNDRLVPVDSYHFVIDLNDGTKEYIVGFVTVIR
jgi:gliding motility-associated-like protein